MPCFKSCVSGVVTTSPDPSTYWSAVYVPSPSFLGFSIIALTWIGM